MGPQPQFLLQWLPQYLSIQHKPQIVKTRTLLKTAKERLESALGLLRKRRNDARNLATSVRSHVKRAQPQPQFLLQWLPQYLSIQHKPQIVKTRTLLKTAKERLESAL